MCSCGAGRLDICTGPEYVWEVQHLIYIYIYTYIYIYIYIYIVFSPLDKLPIR